MADICISALITEFKMFSNLRSLQMNLSRFWRTYQSSAVQSVRHDLKNKSQNGESRWGNGFNHRMVKSLALFPLWVNLFSLQLNENIFRLTFLTTNV